MSDIPIREQLQIQRDLVDRFEASKWAQGKTEQEYSDLESAVYLRMLDRAGQLVESVREAEGLQPWEPV